MKPIQKNCCFLLFVLLLLCRQHAQAQSDQVLDRMALINEQYARDDQSFRFRIQVNAYFIWHGGFGLNFGVGAWGKYDHFQPALNASANFFFHPTNLGNGPSYISKRSPHNPNKSVFNLVFSPILTCTPFTDRWYYEELNPFYFGGASALYNDYKYSVTLGTTFVASPKGTYYNIMSPRNRSQQLIYMQLRIHNFQLNLYEDYFIFTEKFPFSSLSDNRDRYYTGGGNIQFRIGGFYKIKVFSEMYTGNSYVDKQEYPDVAYIKRPPHLMGPRGRKKIEKKLAFQDPGQSVFNKARNFVVFEWNTINYQQMNNGINTHLGFIIGSQGGYQNMWQQNVIHNSSSVNTDNLLKTGRSKLHQFDNSNNFFPHTLLGLNTTINY